MKLNNKKNQFLGYIPDLHDQRDFLYQDFFRLKATRPKLVDLRPKLSAVENQGSLGSCTAQALIGAAEHLWFKAKLTTLNGSRLWLYYKERDAMGTVNEDSGASLRTGIKVLASKGLPQEKLWPYTVSKWNAKPPTSVDSDALKYKISLYTKLTSLTAVKDSLASGYTVPFGITLYESFWRQKAGLIPVPKSSEDVEGGHAMLTVGYDETKKYFIIRNSWGSRWGSKGYCYLPFAYAEQMRDMWCFRQIDDGKV